jgi:hypothetical protein
MAGGNRQSESDPQWWVVSNPLTVVMLRCDFVRSNVHDAIERIVVLEHDG